MYVLFLTSLFVSGVQAESAPPSTAFQLKFTRGTALSTITGESTEKKGGVVRIQMNRGTSARERKLSPKSMRALEGKISTILKNAKPADSAPCDAVEISLAMGNKKWFGCLDQASPNETARELSVLSDSLVGD